MKFKNLLKIISIFIFFTFFIAGCTNTNNEQSTADIQVETDEKITDNNIPSKTNDVTEEQIEASIEINEIEDDVELGELIS